MRSIDCSRFFDAEERNHAQMRQDGDEIGEATLGSALDSWRQAPDDVQETWAGGTLPRVFEAALDALVAEHGEDALLEDLDPVVVFGRTQALAAPTSTVPLDSSIHGARRLATTA